jgi:hypothetical protein
MDDSNDKYRFVDLIDGYIPTNNSGKHGTV